MIPEALKKSSILPWEGALKIERAGKDLPGVSIVIPVFNAGDFLEKTIRSLLCNDLTAVELILMDAGSTDETRAIVDHYRQAFAITVFKKDEGQSDAINKGFGRATMPILYWLNGDDLILPNSLTAVRRTFRDHPGAKVVVGNAYMTEKNLSPIRHFEFSPEKLRFSYLLDYAKNHLVQPSVFFSREAWDATGPLKLDLHYAMDADLFLSMAKQFEFIHIAVDVAYSVYHENCKTRNKRGESIAELALVQARHGGYEFAARTLKILVDMFNGASAEIGKARKGYDAHVGALTAKLRNVELQAEFNRQLLIEADIRLTS